MIDVNELLSGLNESQRQAVSKIDGPVLVLAGPGSGKTRVITSRIAYMISEGIPSHQIVALTFTNKAADEMKVRVADMVSDHRTWIGTFHRFCSRLLRVHAPSVGLSENFTIYDSADAKAAMKDAVSASGAPTSHYSNDQIANEISRLKSRGITPDMVTGVGGSALHSLAARIYPFYRKTLLRANAVDFDDLLLHVVQLLRENPDLREGLDRKFRYIMVDEYQDTNVAQYAIVRALSHQFKNLCVTGDPDQSIYGWRGANLGNILDFESDFFRRPRRQIGTKLP